MIGFAYILTRVVSIVLSILQLLMLLRAILSWMPLDEDSDIVTFIYMMTEPVIFPVRSLTERFGLFEGSPIDVPFFISFLLLSMVQILLPSIF